MNKYLGLQAYLAALVGGTAGAFLAVAWVDSHHSRPSWIGEMLIVLSATYLASVICLACYLVSVAILQPHNVRTDSKEK